MTSNRSLGVSHAHFLPSNKPKTPKKLPGKPDELRVWMDRVIRVNYIGSWLSRGSRVRNIVGEEHGGFAQRMAKLSKQTDT